MEYTIEELMVKMQEFLETLDDEEYDERYATQRAFAAGALDKFVSFLNTPEEPEDMYGTEEPPAEYPYYID